MLDRTGAALGAGPAPPLPILWIGILVATARDLDATFLTSDARILDYASTSGDVRVHDARLQVPDFRF